MDYLEGWNEGRIGMEKRQEYARCSPSSLLLAEFQHYFYTIRSVQCVRKRLVIHDALR